MNFLKTILGRSKKRESICEFNNTDNFNDLQIGYRFGVSDSSHARINFAKPYPEIEK